jgi:thiamine-phosphate pyrophosphorylase
MKKSRIDYRLYFVTEEGLPLDRLLHVIEESVAGGVTVVQLREKRSEGKEFYEKALHVKKLLDSLSVPLIINDRADVALAVGAAGVHVGQSDLPLYAVKKVVPDTMAVGVSVRSVKEAVAAEAGGANYIGVGSVFPTSTKPDAELLPPGRFREIASSVSIPAVAIGGINGDNLEKLKDSGAAGFAVVSALAKADHPKTAAGQLLKTIQAMCTSET